MACRYSANMLHCAVHLPVWDGVQDPIKHWCPGFHLPMYFPILEGIALHNQEQEYPDVASELRKYGLQRQDLEWFSRAAMITACLSVSTADLPVLPGLRQSLNRCLGIYSSEWRSCKLCPCALLLQCMIICAQCTRTSSALSDSIFPCHASNCTWQIALMLACIKGNHTQYIMIAAWSIRQVGNLGEGLTSEAHSKPLTLYLATVAVPKRPREHGL